MRAPSALVDQGLRVFGETRTRAPATAVALAHLLGFAPAARAADAAVAAAGPAPAAEKGASDEGRRTLRRLPANLGRGVVGVVHGDNLVPLLVGGTAAASASFFDQDVRESLQANTLDWGDALETGAGPVWSAVFVAGLFTAGRLSDGSRFRAVTYDMLAAAVVNFGYTELVKVAVGRERPNGEDANSFPSGHTSNSFALAAVAGRRLRVEARRPRLPEVNAGTLSGGYQQKLILARELETDPRLLLAAQPTRGLDVGAIEFVWSQILQQKAEGRAVLLISAELDEIYALSDRIVTLYEGPITGEYAPDAPADEVGRGMLGGAVATEAV